MNYLKRFLAGAIFGGYMAHLLYFLNPQIEIGPVRLVMITAIYALIGGLLFGTALWLLRMMRVRLFGEPPPGSDGFGFIVAAAFVAAALYWIHLSVFHVGLLPIGAVRMLSKSTNLITATAFALLILWFLGRSRRTQTVFAAGVAHSAWRTQKLLFGVNELHSVSLLWLLRQIPPVLLGITMAISDSGPVSS